MRCPTPQLRFPVMAAIAALTLALAACAGAGSEPSPSGTGPLAQWSWDVWGIDQEESNTQALRGEELVAECMAEYGFEYSPSDSVVTQTFPDPDIPEGTREYAEQYGYGIATDPTGMWASNRESWYEPDANNEYVAAMSESEQQAYYAALNGTPPPEGEPWPPRDQGCYGWAYDQVNPDLGAHSALLDEMQQAQEASLAGPRMQELHVAWAACMADAGHPDFPEPIDARTAAMNALNSASAQTYGELPESPTTEQIAAAERQIQPLLAEAVPDEIALAVADFDCQEQVDYQRISDEVDLEYQQAFYDAHRDELEAWRDAVVQARGEQ